jgi:hypothetical protein
MRSQARDATRYSLRTGRYLWREANTMDGRARLAQTLAGRRGSRWRETPSLRHVQLARSVGWCSSLPRARGIREDARLKMRPAKAARPERSRAARAGHSPATALTADGSVWTWGSNNYGELGDGNVSDSTGGPISTSMGRDGMRSGRCGRARTARAICRRHEKLAHHLLHFRHG